LQNLKNENISLLNSNHQLRKSLESFKKGFASTLNGPDKNQEVTESREESHLSSRSHSRRMDTEVEDLKRKINETESEKQMMAKQLEVSSLTLKSLKDKLSSAEQNLGYMFNRSKQLSDSVNEFMMFNFPEIYETSTETHTVNYDRLIHYVEFILNECLALRSKVGFFSPNQSSINTSLVSTQKIRQFNNLDRIISKEGSPDKLISQSISNKTLTPPPKEKTPTVYQPTLGTYVGKKYKTENLTGISVFAKTQTSSLRPSK
jgi:hypothetical protein